jgi:hypothetical protein
MGYFPTSDDAPAELLERLEDVGRFWKGDRESNRVLFRQIGLQDKGLALSIEYWKRFQCPRAGPIEVAFEPVPLDESSPTLRDLAALATDSTNEGTDARRSVHGFVRHWLRVGIPAGGLIMLLVQSAQAIIQDGLRSKFTLTMLAFTLTFVAAMVAVHWIRNCNWFIVPGAVVVRKRSLMKREGKIFLFTPEETLLILQPRAIAINASLIQGEEIVESAVLTKTETVALLGAWQSSIAPPELERLVDLR